MDPFQHLPEDCLEELFARCRTPDLLALGQTCKAFSAILNTSSSIWSSRLEHDYLLKVNVSPMTMTCVWRLSSVP